MSEYFDYSYCGAYWENVFLSILLGVFGRVRIVYVVEKNKILGKILSGK